MLNNNDDTDCFPTPWISSNNNEVDDNDNTSQQQQSGTKTLTEWINALDDFASQQVEGWKAYGRGYDVDKKEVLPTHQTMILKRRYGVQKADTLIAVVKLDECLEHYYNMGWDHCPIDQVHNLVFTTHGCVMVCHEMIYLAVVMRERRKRYVMY